MKKLRDLVISEIARRGPEPEADGAQHFAESQSEQDFMRNVIAYAEARGFLVYHTHISKRSNEGWPDLYMVRRGRMVVAELKREIPRLKNGELSQNQDFQPTDAQKEWLAALRDCAERANQLPTVDGKPTMWVACWRPSDWGEIERLLA